jgi:hypothetical protein
MLQFSALYSNTVIFGNLLMMDSSGIFSNAAIFGIFFLMLESSGTVLHCESLSLPISSGNHQPERIEQKIIKHFFVSTSTKLSDCPNPSLNIFLGLSLSRRILIYFLLYGGQRKIAA